jgi:predicted unusual protein kinase regulating ubiquinone biosynthesis (AarF/ABC1/UbiB family)
MDSWSVGECDCVFLLAERVHGISLKSYIKQHSIDIGFVVTFLGEMLDFLRELQSVGLQHGDFHSGNVLVEDRTASLVGPRSLLSKLARRPGWEAPEMGLIHV